VANDACKTKAACDAPCLVVSWRNCPKPVSDGIERLLAAIRGRDLAKQPEQKEQA